MTDLLTKYQKPFHALSIITTSLLQLPEIDDDTCSEDEVSQLIEQFGQTFKNLLEQSQPEDKALILDQYQHFLNKLHPESLYYNQLHELNPGF